MKFKISFFILTLLMMSSVIFGQAEFLKTYGLPFSGVQTNFNQVAYHQATNSYFAVGNVNSRGTIGRFDANGNQLWNKLFIVEGTFHSVVFNPTNHEIMAVGLDFEHSPSRLVYVHLDAAGNLLDVPKYYAIPNSVRVTRPKILLSTASPATFLISYSNVPADADEDFDNLGLMRIDDSGDIIWANEYFTDRTDHDDQIYDLVSDGAGGCHYTGFTLQESNHSYVGHIDIHGDAGIARRIITPNMYTRFLSIDRFANRLLLGGEDGIEFEGRGVIATVGVNDNSGWARDYSGTFTTVNTVKFLTQNRLIAKRSGSSGITTMDLMVLSNAGATVGGLRYQGMTNNFFAGVDRLANGRALVYNTSSNLPTTIGGVDNFINVVNTASLPGSASCIANEIFDQSSSLAYQVDEFRMLRAGMKIAVTEITKETTVQLLEEDVCCSCEEVKACFSVCDVSCLDCANVFLNCSEPGNCGDFETVEDAYFWEVTNVNTGVVVSTSSDKDFLFIPPGNTNALFKICLTVTDSEGCADTFCIEKNYQCNNTLNKVDQDFGEIPTTIMPDELKKNLIEPKVELSSVLEFSIHPNPSQQLVTLKLNDKQLLESDVMIFNSMGQLVLQQRIGSENALLDVQHLSPGAYILKLLKNSKILGESKLVISK